MLKILYAFIVLILVLLISFKSDFFLSREEKIILAIKENDFEKLKVLVKDRPNLNYEIKKNTPSLFTRKIIDCMPEDFKPKFINKEDTPLDSAIRTDSLECVKILLDAGANPNYLNSSGNSPLFTLNMIDIMSCCSIVNICRTGMYSLLLNYGAKEIESGMKKAEPIEEEEFVALDTISVIDIDVGFENGEIKDTPDSIRVKK